MLDSLHLLLTYQCSGECPHCFVWGGPVGPTMTSAQVQELIESAEGEGVSAIAFEGGEPFLYYPILQHGVRCAQQLGLKATVVTNGVWAITQDEAVRWLRPLTELGSLGIAISTDDYHGGQEEARRAEMAAAAARILDLEPVFFRTAPENVMFRGRAAEELTDEVEHRNWEEFNECPHESLLDPARAHVDALGYLQLCQGLCPGRTGDKSLSELLDPEQLAAHPLIPVIDSDGPAGLVREFDLPLKGEYADACHLCYRARAELRGEFPQYLGPPRVYGDFS